MGICGHLVPARDLHRPTVGDISRVSQGTAAGSPSRYLHGITAPARSSADTAGGITRVERRRDRRPRPGRPAHRQPSRVPEHLVHGARRHAVDLFRHRRLVALLADGRRRRAPQQGHPPLAHRARAVGLPRRLVRAHGRGDPDHPGLLPQLHQPDRDRLRDRAVALDRPLRPLLSRLHRLPRHLRGPQAVDRQPPARALDLRHAASPHRCHLHAHLGRQLDRHHPGDDPAGAAHRR